MDGTVFVGTEGHTFFAIDPRQAKILWRYEDAEHGAAFRSSAAATPDAVIVGGRDKQLHAFDPKTGRQLWTFATKGRVDSSPVVVGDRVFFGSADGRLYGLKRENRQEALAVRGRRGHRGLARRGRRPAGDRQRRRRAVLLWREEISA